MRDVIDISGRVIKVGDFAILSVTQGRSASMRVCIVKNVTLAKDGMMNCRREDGTMYLDQRWKDSISVSSMCMGNHFYDPDYVPSFPPRIINGTIQEGKRLYVIPNLDTFPAIIRDALMLISDEMQGIAPWFSKED